MDISNLNKEEKILALIEDIKTKQKCFNMQQILFSDESDIEYDDLFNFFSINIENITHITPKLDFIIYDKWYDVITTKIDSLSHIIDVCDNESIAFYDIIKSENGYLIRMCKYNDIIKIKIHNRNNNLDYVLNKKNHSN